MPDGLVGWNNPSVTGCFNLATYLQIILHQLS